MADPKATVRAWRTGVHTGVDRRRTLRISVPFPIQVRAVSAAGEPHQFYAKLDNLSAGGLYVRTTEDMRPWRRIMIHIHLSLGSDAAGRVPTVAARGTVLRTDPQPDQRLGFAIAFRGYRIK